MKAKVLDRISDRLEQRSGVPDEQAGGACASPGRCSRLHSAQQESDPEPLREDGARRRRDRGDIMGTRERAVTRSADTELGAEEGKSCVALGDQTRGGGDQQPGSLR